MTTSLHATSRVPVDDAYAALVGKAIYVFAYYEWTLIYIMEQLESGFVAKYSRGEPLESGKVLRKFRGAIDGLTDSFNGVSKAELVALCDEFKRLIVQRNALIHAHPITDADGAQILAYQTQTTRPLPDMKWPSSALVSVIAEFDTAACQAGLIFERLNTLSIKKLL
jgi:hypothetical protein